MPGRARSTAEWASPLLEGEQTCRRPGQNDAIDPKRKSRRSLDTYSLVQVLDAYRSRWAKRWYRPERSLSNSLCAFDFCLFARARAKAARLANS